MTPTVCQEGVTDEADPAESSPSPFLPWTRRKKEALIAGDLALFKKS